MKTVVLSPHADDAVWSLGGLLSLIAPQICVITIYDGDPPDDVTAAPASAWRGFRSAAVRRSEDAKAAGLLGLTKHSLGEPDAAFRRNDCGEFLFAGLADVFPSYERLKALRPPAWLDRLAALIEPDDIVLAPMAFGRHVDHYLTLLAAREIAADRLVLYAEFPYWDRADTAPVHAHLAALDLQTSMVEVPVPWDAWRAAAAAYRSQVLRIFGGHAAFVAQLEQFAERRDAQATCPFWVKRCL